MRLFLFFVETVASELNDDIIPSLFRMESAQLIFTREQLEEREARMLAPYAAFSRDSAGREHPEEPPRYRTNFQRDWNRISHTAAYRRLKFKTQVFPFGQADDASRDRLTHTLETVQIATSIARSLGLNEDLARAIAMAHDIGHPPFGHAVEGVLGQLVKHFDHNEHGLKILRYLEKRYEDFYGLNLSLEVLEGLQKHETVYDRRGANEEFFPGMSPTMEAQVVNAADAIAFRTHDLEDALRLHVISLEDVDQAGMELWRRTGERVAKMSDRVKATQRTRALIDMMIRDVLEETERRVGRNSIKSLEDVRVYKDALVSFSAGMQGDADALSQFLHKRFYNNFRVVRMVNKGKRVIEELFRAYDEHPEILPPGLRSEIDKGREKQSRVIADYIAGMTDRFAIEEHRRIFSIEHRA